eukprot:gene2012-2334_t
MCRTTDVIPTELEVDRNADPKPAAYQPSLDRDDNAAHCNAHVSNCALNVQEHHHTHTCAKNGHSSNDFGCRVAMPRPAVQHTSIIAGSNCLVGKCSDPHLSPYIPSLMLPQPANQAVWLSSEASGFLRDHYIWALAKQAGSTVAAPPKLPSGYAAAAEKAEYCAKYTSKADNVHLGNGVSALAVQMLERAQQYAAQQEAPASTGCTCLQEVARAAGGVSSIAKVSVSPLSGCMGAAEVLSRAYT